MVQKRIWNIEHNSLLRIFPCQLESWFVYSNKLIARYWMWEVGVLNVPKLRTYVLFKISYETEPYVSVFRNRRHRSVMAQFRGGILPFRVETGRFMSIPPEYRLCLLCDTRILKMRLTSYFIVNSTQTVGRTGSRMPNLNLVILVR